MSLIKQESQKKSRKLIVDWDEVLQPLKTMLLYQLSSKKLSLPEYFKGFWERARMHYTKSHGRGGQFVVDEKEAKKYFGQSLLILTLTLTMRTKKRTCLG